MKIAYLIPSLINRGPVIVVRDLVNVMTAYGHQCTIYYFDELEHTDINCPVERICMRYSINFNDFDVVHSHGIRPDFYVFLHKPLSCRAVCISTVHSFIFEDLASQYNKLVSFIVGKFWIQILSKHDKIAVLTKKALEYYKKKLPENKLKVVYNTRIINTNKKLSLEDREHVLNFKGNSVCLGINAMLTPIKGIEQVIKSLSLLENVKLWIVGDGKSMSTLQMLSDECGVRSRVYFAGYKEEAFRYLEYYDVFLMPSRCEGFGLTLLEAACYKVPTVCSNIPVFKELFSSHEVSFFELDKIESLVKAIEHAIGNKNLASNMNERYVECYSPDSFYRNYLSTYAE
ncbi:glycosyltransferase family 4 protein [Bacteroides uniformis]|uniref:glycosyltransferase family 4 protein n=1 Tax=Bacteroides uniformis TaxID=820 RepID=UPI0018994FD6|nr:glycosyltransferase family 4 protein [Bacteroides uniformis]